MLAQYSAAALVADCRRLAVPASVDSIPTSAMQEDHVSMGWAAARKLRRAIDNATPGGGHRGHDRGPGHRVAPALETGAGHRRGGRGPAPGAFPASGPTVTWLPRSTGRRTWSGRGQIVAWAESVTGPLQ